MLCATALPVLAALVQLLSIGGELELRTAAERGTLSTSPGGTEARGSFSAIPVATLLAGTRHGGLELRYAPRLWTPELGSGAELLVNHRAEARVRTSPERTWRWSAFAAASRGDTDPLVDDRAPGDAGQLVTTQVLRYQELRAGTDANVAFGARTTLALAAAWQVSGADRREDRDVLPIQRQVDAQAALTRLATERDTVELSLRWVGSRTDRDPAARAAFASLTAGWRRRTSQHVTLRIAGGATISWAEELDGGIARDLVPAGDAGFAWTSNRTSADVVARAATLVDRRTGALEPILEGQGVVRRQIGEHLAVTWTASGGARTDGTSAYAAGELRLGWSPGAALALELGGRGRRQRERGDLPSFTELTAFAGLTLRYERLFAPREADPGR